jgi:hypothetical protein
MADITMCRGEGCPMKNTCWRFLAKPDEFRQSYFTSPPNANNHCEHYWKTKIRLLPNASPSVVIDLGKEGK